jgi:hypothetical protein
MTGFGEELEDLTRNAGRTLHDDRENHRPPQKKDLLVNIPKSAVSLGRYQATTATSQCRIDATSRQKWSDLTLRIAYGSSVLLE